MATMFNPVQLISESLNGQTINNASIVGPSVPVEWNESISVVTQAVEDVKPVTVLSIGLAPNTRFIRVEKIGLNLRCMSSDNGKRYVFSKVEPDGPSLLVTDIPTHYIAKEIRKSGISARQSFFAGTYICNNLFYGLLKYKQSSNPDLKVCFVHVPPLKSMDSKNGMSLDEMTKAVKLVITLVLEEMN
ncbi:MAG: hypothetical protein DRN01_03755 [Thermoplasmata archaeon]|nr:MAG: hypothetical protein FE035_00520 [Thermoplasmata archaeon]RLF26895.1 MAG: hypothetical protein DRN01_03755 [Thermoplasmata archaeon]